MPPKNQVKKFCSISKYIQQNDKEFYQALDDLCLFGLFRPRGNGVTFMYPDKDYRKKIVKEAYSDSPESAVEMVRNLVLLDFLPNHLDFDKKTIATALHKKLEVESAEKDHVTLKSKHKIVKETKFITLRNNDPVALYLLTGKGILPVSTERVDTRLEDRNHQEKEGGVEFNLAALTKFIEDTFIDNKKIYQAVMGLFYECLADNYDSHKSVIDEIYYYVGPSALASYYIIIAGNSAIGPINGVEHLLSKLGFCNLPKLTEIDLNKFLEKYSAAHKNNLKSLKEKMTDHQIEKKIITEIPTYDSAQDPKFNYNDLKSKYKAVYGSYSEKVLYAQTLNYRLWLLQRMDNSQKQTLKEIMMTLKSQALDQLSTYNCPDVAFKISCADIVMSDCYMAHFYIGNKFEQFNYMAPVQTKLFTILDDMFIKKGGFEGGSDDTCVGKKLNAFHP
jgi:hypothetical protein